MSGLRRRIALSDSPLVRALRRCRRAVLDFTLPAPRLIVRPVLAVFLALRTCYYYLFRLFVCEPLFKAYCETYGKGVRTGAHIHWVSGAGKLILGDYVLVEGLCSFSFAARYAENPTLTIGDYTIMTECAFTVGREITIGRHCMIASGCRFFDAPGHPTDPESRKAGNPANLEDVRPIRLHDNVWIGTEAMIFPGVTIGEGSVVVARSVVVNDVPAYSMVAGNPARVIQRLPGSGAPAGKGSGVERNGGAIQEPARATSAGSLDDVLEIVRRALGADVGPAEDFYDAGMTSIMTLPLLVEIEQRFGVTIPEYEFSDARTAQELAACIDMALAR